MGPPMQMAPLSRTTKSPYSHLFRALVHDAVRGLQLEVLPDALDLVQVPLALQRVALVLDVLALLRKFKVTALPTHDMSCIEHLLCVGRQSKLRHLRRGRCGRRAAGALRARRRRRR